MLSRERATQALDATGITGWYNPADLGALTSLVRDARDVDGVAVEFGSYQGRSSVAIARVLGRPLICVDPWQDVPGLATGDTVYAAFCQNTRHHSITHHRSGWREYLAATAPYGLAYAFCHIDADHAYTEVRDTIQAMLPLIAPNGILCGHDYGWPDGSHAGVTRAVDELLPRRTVNGSVWSYRKETP